MSQTEGSETVSALLISDYNHLFQRLFDLCENILINYEEILNFINNNSSLNLNTTNFNGDTLLHKAAGLGHVNFLVSLISRGVNVNAQNDLGETALISALKTGQYQIADLLLNHPNIDVHTRTNFKDTALWYALNYLPVKFSECPLEKQVITKLVSKYKEEINSPIDDIENNTPWAYACINGRLDFLEILIDHPYLDPNTGNAALFPILSGPNKSKMIALALTHEKVSTLLTSQRDTEIHFPSDDTERSLIEQLINLWKNEFYMFIQSPEKFCAKIMPIVQRNVTDFDSETFIYYIYAHQEQEEFLCGFKGLFND